MTREEILKMEAGPKLDALIAEKVMDLKDGKDFGEWDCHDRIYLILHITLGLVGMWNLWNTKGLRRKPPL